MRATLKRSLGFALGIGIVAMAGAASAQDDKSLFGIRTSSVTYGPYARVEMGVSMPDLGGAYWLPPGAADPRIDFAANPAKNSVGFGALAVGFDWQTGVRGDVSIFGAGKTGVSAPCSSASDGTPCSAHADITSTSIRSNGVMANVFYAPLEARGSNAVFQPFIVGGLGISRNTVGEWTRVKNPGNPTFASDTTRTFKGDTTTRLAWSLGIGASLQVTRPGKWPVLIEASWRYYDFGSASGSAEPVAAGSQPRQPLTFDTAGQVVTIGLRVPLKRF